MTYDENSSEKFGKKNEKKCLLGFTVPQDVSSVFVSFPGGVDFYQRT